MRRAFPNMRLELRGFRVKSGVGEQPLGHSTIELGAHNRAKAACNVWPACDYSIGLESGLLPFGGRYFDLQFACISDGSADTFGCSMGFPLPKNIAGKMIKTNKTKNKFSRFRVTCSLGSVIDKLSGEKNVGRGKGAISFLSRGLLERKEMTEQAVLCALVERRSPV